MKRRCVFAVLAALLFTTSGIAVEGSSCCLPCCEPCGYLSDICNPCEGWTLDLDFLYWKPRRCELIYAAAGTEGDLKIKEIELCYDDGYRVGVFKECGGMLVGLRYTKYSYKDRQGVTNSEGVLSARISDAFSTSFVIARSRYDLHLDMVEIEAAYQLYEACDLNAKAFGGFRVAAIDQKLDTIYGQDAEDLYGPLRDVEIAAEKNDMEGYGLYVGGAGSYTFCDCFSVNGMMSVGTMVADFDRHYVQTQIEDGVTTSTIRYKDSCYKIVSTFDFGVGVGYDLCDLCNADLSLSLGYEFHYWLNSLDFLLAELSSNPNAFVVDRHSEDLGFDGLVVRLTGKF